jgi:hypothetical protein
MEITLDLDESLLEQAKNIAAISNRTLAKVVEDALRDALARAMMPRRDVKLPISQEKGGLMPGVDLNNGLKLRDILDKDEPLDKLR